MPVALAATLLAVFSVFLHLGVQSNRTAAAKSRCSPFHIRSTIRRPPRLPRTPPNLRRPPTPEVPRSPPTSTSPDPVRAIGWAHRVTQAKQKPHATRPHLRRLRWSLRGRPAKPHPALPRSLPLATAPRSRVPWS
jgi:hypothetical protein